MYAFLADLTVAVHVGYVAFVVLGQLLIWIGLLRGWQWVRNPWFRSLHLLAITIVVVEELNDWRCPLTVWEEMFREKAGQPTSGGTFLGRLLHSIIFFDFEPWVFTVIYLTCGTLVLGTFLCFPPRRFGSSRLERLDEGRERDRGMS